MSTENKSDFLDIQKDICEVVPEPEPSPKICPTCVPDKKAITPNWWEEAEPFLDKRDCTYSVTVAINDDGESYDVAKMTSEGRNIKQLIETYKRFGLLQLMRFYNKEISNETLFAFPNDPEKLERLNQQANRKMENSIQVLEQQLPNGSFTIHEIPGPILEAFGIKEGEEFNPFAAELFVKANDYYISTYQTPSGGEPILVQVTIPAFIFDRIPQAKPIVAASIQREVILEGINLKRQIERLQAAMGVFGKYQAYWWQTEKGRLVFQKTFTPDQDLTVEEVFDSPQGLSDFYCTLFTNKLGSFIEKLETLIESNTNFRLRRFSSRRSVEHIKISFDNSDPQRPYNIKKIEVKGKGCDYEDIPLGSIKRQMITNDEQYIYPFNDQTLLGYVANINKINQDLLSKETPPWVDFCLQYTFPPLDIEYGKEDQLTAEFGQPETILGCVIDNLGGEGAIRDFFLEQIMTFFDSIAYKWNQNNCKALAGTYVTREEQIAKGGKGSELTALEQNQQDREAISAPYDEKIQPLQKEIAERNEAIKYWEEQIEAVESSRFEEDDVLNLTERQIEEYIKDFQGQIDAAKSQIKDLKEQIKKIEKEKRSALNPISKENRQKRKKDRQSKRQTDRRERKGLQSSRKTKRSLKEDVEDLNRNQRRSIRKQAREESRGRNRREDRADRRRERGERAAERDPFVSASREIVSKAFPFEDSLIQLFLTEEEFKQYGIRGFDFMGGLRDASSGNRGEEKQKRLQRFLSRLGVCGLTKLGQRAVQCLLGGVDLNTGLRAIIRAALNSMSPNYMERLLIGLDPRVQEEIRKQVEREFGNMPAPWEVGYRPGSKEQFSGETREVAFQDKVDSLERQKEILNDVIDTLSNYRNGILDLNPEDNTIKEYTKEEALNDFNVSVLVTEEADRSDFARAYTALNSFTYPIWGIHLREKIPDIIEEYRKDIDSINDEIDQAQLDSDDVKFREWRNLSDEEKEELRERERQVAEDFADGASVDVKINQGTIGKALGSIQETIFDAYVDAIMDNVEIQELFSILDKFPGARLIARLIASFDCPNVHFIYPPVKSFLGSLTFDDCLDRGNVKLPEIRRVPKLSSIREALFTLAKDILKDELNNLANSIYASITLKFLMVIENALCKSLEAVGQFAAEAVQGPNANFSDVINELICGGNSDEDEIDDVSSSLLSSIGVTPQRLQNLAQDLEPADIKGQYRQVMNSISNVISGNEMRQLMVANPGEADPLVLARISRTVSLQNPAFAIFFDSPDKVEELFAAMGNFMTPEQRQQVRDDLANPQFVPQTNSSICLTQEQLEAFEDQKRNIWSNCGLDPQTIEENLAKERDRNRQTIFDVADQLAKGPANIFQEALDKALLPEECKGVNGIIPLEDPITAKENDIIVEGVFRSLQRTYQNDMIGKNDSFLENVLADTTDLSLKKHERRANSESFYIDYANSTEDWDAKKKRFEATAVGNFYFDLLSNGEAKGVFPDTVAIKMKEELENQTFDINFTYDIESRPGKEEKFVRTGLLGRQTNLEIPKPYLKKPDMKLNFDNGNDYKADFDIDLSFTKFKNGDVQIQKDFGYKVNIYTTVNVSIDVDLDGEEDFKFGGTVKEYGVFSPQQIDQSASVVLAPYDVSIEDLNQKKISYQGYVLSNLVNAQLQSASHAPIPATTFVNGFYNNFLQKSFDTISKGLLTTLDGQTSDGFTFGYEADPLTPADLLYVNPESNPNDRDTWEYTYEEEDAVLGRSATNNPRVHFLDPNIYGGRYTNPPIYVEPSTYTGWLGLSQIIVPEIDGCEPKRTDFIDIKQIAKNVRIVETSIPQDPRLSEDPDCVKRIPFDKISDASTLAFLDGIVTATIRTYASEAMLKSMPMFAFLEYKDINYDDGFSQLIVQEMERGLPEQEAFFGGRIEGYVYYLLFLEQAVQSAVRKIDNGEISSTPEIEEARKKINQAQVDYIYPQKRDLETLKEIEVLEGTAAGYYSARIFRILDGIKILGFPKYAETQTAILDALTITTAFLSIGEIRFASKISLINELRRPCKVLLKALVDHELKFLSSKVENDDRFRPYVSDLSKYCLALPDFVYGSTLKSGLMDIEKPKVGGELDIDYGDVAQVSSEPSMTNKLTELGLTEAQLASVAENGGLYIEKYIRTIDKPRQGPSLANQSREDQQEPRYLQVIRQRPSTLKGVCNISEFNEWASTAKQDIPNELNISDLFGDANLSGDTADTYEGSIGIKFGVRLVLIPNEQLKTLLAGDSWNSVIVNTEKSYSFADTSVVPLVSYERDIKDVKFNELDFTDSSLGEDLKCYIDKLVSTDQYRLVMDYLIGLRKVPTIMSIYMNHTFLASVGSSESERDEDAKLLGFIDITSDAWKAEVLEDTKKECRRLFASFYRSDDFAPEEGADNDASLREVLDKTLAVVFAIPRGFIHWLRRRRLRSRPFDKDGNPCKNVFQRVFNPE